MYGSFSGRLCKTGIRFLLASGTKAADTSVETARTLILGQRMQKKRTQKKTNTKEADNKRSGHKRKQYFYRRV